MKRALGLGLALALALLAACGEPPKPCPPTAGSARPVAGVELFGTLPNDAAAAGAGPFHVLAQTLGTEGDRAGAYADIPTGACLLVAGIGSPGVNDVDAFAFDDAGSTIGADEAPLPRAVFMICPPHPERVYIAARIVTGAGLVAVGTAEVAPDRATAVARALHARNQGDDSGRLDSWPGLEAKVRERRRMLGSRWDDVRRLALPVDPRAPTRTSIEMEPGRCLDVLATPSEEVASLELVAEASGGRIVARALPDGRDRVMILCSGTGETVTLALRARGAPGIAAVVVGVSTEGAEAEIARSTRVDRVTATEALAIARKTLAADLKKAGLPDAKLAGTGEAKVGSRAGVDLQLAEGCARVDVIAGTPLGSLGAAIWDDKGTLVAESRGGARATLYACGPARSARIDVEADTKPGPFAVEIRQLPDTPKSFVARGLAAGRLLARLYGDAAVLPADLSRAKEIALTPTTKITEPLDLQPDTCMDVASAVDLSGSGLELRLHAMDDASDTITRGRFVVMDRVCATVGAKKVMAELRLSTDSGSAFVIAIPVQ